VGLVGKQSGFLLDVCKLIRKAHDLGFIVTGGELYRTKDQQQLYFAIGRSKTMDSMHCKRLAIDLNFFTQDDDVLELTYEKNDMQEAGDFWESLHQDNQWGGNWTTFLDTCHFERRPRE